MAGGQKAEVSQAEQELALSFYQEKAKSDQDV